MIESRRIDRTMKAALAFALVLGASQQARADETMSPDDPIAGVSDGQFYLRSPDNMFVLLPGGRLQVDYYGYSRPTGDMNESTVLLRRARLEAAGWVGGWFYWNLAGDFAAGAPAGADPRPQSFLNATDDFVAIAPWGDLAILQAGQFDAPFTLENRTSDKYFDFMERSMTVRVLGEPNNKEVGAMLHGMPKNKLFYYSGGLFNGDGQNFKNVDADIDFMGRAWVAPFALTDIDELKSITLGGSVLFGKRGPDGNALNTGTTQAGFKFFDSKFTLPDGKTSAEIHQRGKVQAFALEANVPIAHKVGARFEYVRKTQDVDEDDISQAANGKLSILASGSLDAFAMYGELWGWVWGDDRIIGDPGLQLPTRLKPFKVAHPKHGLMLAGRLDYLKQTISTDHPELKDPAIGTTKAVSVTGGINYWYSKRFRATFNYVNNNFSGDAPYLQKAEKKLNGGTTEHEFLLRLGIAL